MKIFLDHTPKCGGSYLQSSLKPSFKEDRIFLNYIQFNISNKNIFDTDIDIYDFICGHFDNKLKNFEKLKNWTKIFIFRNPIHLLKSKYFFGLEGILYGRSFSNKYLSDKDFINRYEDLIFGPKIFTKNIFSKYNSVYRYSNLICDIDFIKTNYDYIVDTQDLKNFNSFFIKKYNLKKVDDKNLNYNKASKYEHLFNYFYKEIEEYTSLFEPDFLLYNKLKEICWKE